MLVKLSEEVSVNPEYVLNLSVNYDRDTVTVVTVDGGIQHIECDYGRSIWQTADRITKLINGREDG